MRQLTVSQDKHKITTRSLTMIAMLGALSAILMVLDFHVPFSPTFVKFDFSDLPIMIGGFLLGPLAGVLIGIIKILLNFLLNGTTTMFVGELANLVLTIAYVLPASWLYQKNKTKEQAVKGLMISVLVTSILAVLSNIYFIFPVYATLFGMSIQDIVQMAVVTNPLVKDLTTMIVFSLLPFNIFKYTVISILTMISYKKLSYLFKREISK